ncbi:MAG: sulfatase [Rikenellaceae bacterium]
MNRPNQRSLAIVLTAAACASCSSDKPTQPNILFIMSDDHTSQAVGIYGSRLAALDPTPTIDRIGREGMVMENAFCTNSISTPSRACIISGQYSQTSGVLDLADTLQIANQNLPIVMKSLGYETAMVGKWHLGEQPEMFDYYNVYYGQGTYFDPVLYEKGCTDSLIVKMSGPKLLPGKAYKGHESDVVTDISLDWLENKRDKSKPFFLCHQFKAPHDFFEFNPRYKDYLEDIFIPEPESLWQEGNHGSAATRGYNDSLRDTIGSSVGRRNRGRDMGRDLKMNLSKSLSDDEYKRAAYQEYLKRYLRCVKGVDDNVKRIFDYLEANNLMDNTIIVYTGDQGFFLGEHDYIDKRWMYEEAMRMPFLVRYPAKIKAGSRSDAIVNNVDYAATLIEMAGGQVPDVMQGDSFKEILYTGKEPEGWKSSTYYRYWMHMAHRHNNPAHFGVRTKDYKLIFFYGVNYDDIIPPRSLSKFQTPPGWELYDLKKDPREMNNVYGQAEYAQITGELKAELKRLREEYNEGDEKYPHIQKIIDLNWNK